MISDNIDGLKARMLKVCSRANRSPDEITIVAVSKGRTCVQIREAIEAGITDIGENRVQEAVIKFNELRKIKWHMVGHLQTNKAKQAVKIFDLIHSVDSMRLAEELNKQAQVLDKVQDILIQVNTSGEQTKFGLKPVDLIRIINEMVKFKNLNIKGLMTIAALVDNPQNARPYFSMLRELKDKINHLTNNHLTILSMGMTDDFEVAIEEGANMVRIGRAIFEGT